MNYPRFFRRYRMVCEAITNVAMIGTALLAGYLILWARL